VSIKLSHSLAKFFGQVLAVLKHLYLVRRGVSDGQVGIRIPIPIPIRIRIRILRRGDACVSMHP